MCKEQFQSLEFRMELNPIIGVYTLESEYYTLQENCLYLGKIYDRTWWAIIKRYDEVIHEFKTPELVLACTVTIPHIYKKVADS